MKKKNVILSFFVLLILNILLIISNEQEKKYIQHLHKDNDKLTIDIYDYKTYIKENIMLTRMRCDKLKRFIQTTNNADTLYIIMFPNGACSGCISELLSENFMNDLPKNQTYIITENQNDWLRRELKSNRFHNYYCYPKIFQDFDFKEKIVIAKYINKYNQLHCIIYTPQYNEFIECFL